MLSGLLSTMGLKSKKKKFVSQVPETGLPEDPIGFARYIHEKGRDQMQYKAGMPDPIKQTPAQNVAVRLANNARKKSRALAAINQNVIPASVAPEVPMEKSTDATATSQKALSIQQTPLPAYQVDV